MKKQVYFLVLLLITLVGCRTIGEMKTSYKEIQESRHFANKVYKMRDLLFGGCRPGIYRNVSFDEVGSQRFRFLDSIGDYRGRKKIYTYRDTVGTFKGKSNFIAIEFDPNEPVWPAGFYEDFDIFQIYIKADSLYETEYQLDDNNTIIYRILGFGYKFSLTGINGKLVLTKVSEKETTGIIDLSFSKIYNPRREPPTIVSLNGKFEGSFSLETVF